MGSQGSRKPRTRRYAYALECRDQNGRWFLSVDWPCYRNLKAAEARVKERSEHGSRYRVRKLEFVS